MRYDLVMNNASQAPWWFAAIVAGITVTGTLVSVWLTNKYANKRSQRELENQRAQFEKQWESQRDQFRAQIDEQKEIERRKLVHETREKLYVELCDAFSEAAEKAAMMSLRVEGQGIPDHQFKVTTDGWTELRKLQTLSIECKVVASEEVRVCAKNIAGAFQLLIKEYFQAMRDGDESVNLDQTWDFAKEEFEVMTTAMRKDLGVVE